MLNAEGCTLENAEPQENVRVSHGDDSEYDEHGECVLFPGKWPSRDLDEESGKWPICDLVEESAHGDEESQQP